MKQNVYARLTKPLLERSISDDYDEAKKEWRMTGHIWKGEPPEHSCGHVGQCLCGKNIVWHFEIENTETEELQILGSSCIENWMVLRHLTEMVEGFKGVDINTITDETIQDWLENAINIIKAEWWFKENGMLWNLMYDSVAEIDLRTNVYVTGRYYDSKTKRHEDKTRIRKRASGQPGDFDYQMASVIWRWNHPDNKRNQQEKFGFPQDKLWADICILYGRVENEKKRIAHEDAEREDRISFLEANDARKRISQALRTENIENANAVTFEQNCEFYDIPVFTPEEASNDWEVKFLRDMRTRIVNDGRMSDGQMEKLRGILLNEGPKASIKQIKYLRILGVSEIPEGLTKADASRMIDEARQNDTR